MFRLLAIISLLCLSTFGSQAQDRFETPVEGELLSGWQRADGTRMAAIRLTLAPGWKTYWRAPGFGGIPPQFDWSGSRNLKGVGVTWPTPRVFHQAGMQSYGYVNELILPVALEPRRAGKPMHIQVDLDIGVCSDICIPHQMSVSGTINDTNTKPTPAIAAAVAARPYSGSEAGVRAATCRLRPSDNGLTVEAKLTLPHAGGKEAVVLEPAQPGLWVGEMQAKRSGNTLTAHGELISENGGAIALDRSALKITVLGQNHAVEIVGCKAG
jgi:DsbC/DsbD-like thiol-disulfide interchange protein